MPRPVFAFNSPYGINSPYDPDEANEEFMDKSNQRLFVRKVFCILTLQVLSLAGLVCLMFFPTEIKGWALLNHFLFVGFLLGLILLIVILLCCCGDFPRSFPGNVVSLIGFTIVEGLTLGSLAAVYELFEVAVFLGILAYLCLTIVFFTFQERLDFTTITAGFFVAFIIIPAVIFLLFFLTVGQVVATGLIALYIVVNFAFHTHRMMMSAKLNPNESVFASLNVHLDIFTFRGCIARGGP